ncbi:MAG: MerR family transcriptional regulator [Alphaproteobacteria bacterium]
MSESRDLDLQNGDRESPQKSAAAFRTISEVANQLEVPQHVLRFWESKFPQVRPMKRAGGRRYYRPEDVQLLRRIRELLHQDGYTIRGVQRLLKEKGARALVKDKGQNPEVKTAAPSGLSSSARAKLSAVVAELQEIRAELDGDPK